MSHEQQASQSPLLAHCRADPDKERVLEKRALYKLPYQCRL
nr:MAG TPA: hypothetical protein [Caudoviricetes sp.]